MSNFVRMHRFLGISDVCGERHGPADLLDVHSWIVVKVTSFLCLYFFPVTSAPSGIDKAYEQ